MKKITAFLLLTMFFVFAFVPFIMAQDDNAAITDLIGLIPATVWKVIAGILIVVEIAMRLYPTWKNNAPLNKILKFLAMLSEKANVSKN